MMKPFTAFFDESLHRSLPQRLKKFELDCAGGDHAHSHAELLYHGALRLFEPERPKPFDRVFEFFDGDADVVQLHSLFLSLRF
jgi:hypothetical protein